MRIVIQVDNLVRINYQLLKKHDRYICDWLKDRFTYDNPTFIKNEKLGFATTNIPKKIKSYFLHHNHIYFARGCFRTIKTVFKKRGLDFQIVDNCASFHPEIFNSKIKLRPEQIPVVNAMLKYKHGYVNAPCCLVGDTIISCNRGGKGYKETIQNLYNKLNGNPEKIEYLKQYKSDNVTNVRSFNGKSIQLNQVEKVIYSGKRLVYELELVDGKKLQATYDHKIMTKNGYVKMHDLTNDHYVMLDVDKAEKSNKNKSKSKCKRKREKEVQNLWYHPYASEQNKHNKYYTKKVPLHKAIFESYINNITFEEYKRILRNDKKLSEKLFLIDSRIFSIHHINHDHFDNRIENLQILTRKDHSLLHSKVCKFNFNQGIPKYSKVKSIKKIGFKKTYDICCKSPHNNFVANGIVVHNSSGKTVMVLEAIARAKQPTCVIVWDTNLQKQWMDEATNKNLLNLSEKEIGGVGGIFKKRKFGKLNICMQQSLYKKQHSQFFADKCGFVACDEIQRGATRTYQDVLHEFSSKYRIGVTADEKRTDGKEFLIYDSFGSKPIYVMPDHEADNVKKANIYLIKTKYENYRYEITLRTPELLNDMAQNPDRNNLIIKRALQQIKKNKIVLILVERKWQALFLNEMLGQHCKGMLLIGSSTTKEINLADWPQRWKDYMKDYNPYEESEKIKVCAKNKRINYIIATQKGNVGLSIRTLDHVIVTTPTNIKLFNQKKGRVERDYNKELIKKYGSKKTPSIDYLWDVRINPLIHKGNDIMNNFPNVKVLN